MSRAILVEDNTRLAALLEKSLLRIGVELDRFGDIRSARQALSLCQYAILILDRGLPDGDGLTLLHEMGRSPERIPCIVLTARDSLHDRVEGLDGGADDYLSKPFAMEEFIARVRALMRRPRTVQPQMHAFADLRLEVESATLLCGHQELPVSQTEIQILLSLMTAAGSHLGRQQLEQAAWGIGRAVTPGALDVAIHRLRKKIEQLGSVCSISNTRGIGYALDEKTAS